jgi:UDP-glucuronate 4-epimerase
MKILVTGAAGFIGFHLAKKLLERGDEVIGLDSINDYYDTRLKYDRLEQTGIKQEEIGYNKLVESKCYSNYRFIQLNLEDQGDVESLFKAQGFERVCNLAAQAGVRYSLENPMAYVNANMVGFANILEGCRHYGVNHLVYASSSSVYGMNKTMPFAVDHNVDHPVSLYAASKKSNELMAHTYSHLYNLPNTGLRFFTVYGPWGRPDMALFLFTKAILEDNPIQIFNNGNMKRDFTYIDDIIEGVVRVIDNPAQKEKNRSPEDPTPGSSSAPYKVYNIGNNHPENLMDFIHEIENALGKTAQKEFLPMQPGDVEATWADVQHLIDDFGYKPNTSIKEGIQNFVDWYVWYYDYEVKNG